MTLQHLSRRCCVPLGLSLLPLGPPHARGRLGQPGVLLPLPGGAGDDAERVQRPPELGAEHGVHQAVPFNGAEPLEASADHQEPKVGLGAGGAAVAGGVVLQVEVGGLQGCRQLGEDGAGDGAGGQS